MAEVATYTLPVYEAVVCGLALTRLQEKESEQRDLQLLRSSIDLEEKMRTAIETFQKGDLSRISKSDIEPIAVALATLVSTIRRTDTWFRDSIEIISSTYLAAQKNVLAQIERNNERLEEIAEAWCMAIDESCTSEIREALRTATKTEDVKPWREVLASVKD
jgi:methyl-accepting chemotaxis protein